MDAEAISIASDIAVGVSALIVAGVAFFGVRKWRKELTGKAKFDVARNVMLLGLKLNAYFEWARNPFTYSGESTGRSRQENESSNVSQVLDEWYARGNRLKPIQEDLVKIQEASWEAEILLGEDSSKRISEAIEVYNHSYGELSSAIYSYFEERHREVTSSAANIDHNWLKELHQIIYSRTEDDFAKTIDEATAELKSALKAYVK